MNSIQPEEIRSLKVSSLPSRPTAPASFGGLGYTASDLKAAFDRLPLFLVEKLNVLIGEVNTLSALISDTRERVTDAEAQTDSFHERLTEAEEDFQSLSSDLSDAVALTAGFDARIAAIASLAETAQSVAERVDAVEESVSTLSDALADGEADIADYASRLSAAESTLQSIAEDLETINETIGYIFDDISALYDENSDINETVGEFSAGIELISSLNDRLAALENGTALRRYDAASPALRDTFTPETVFDCGDPTDAQTHNTVTLNAGEVAGRGE